jgi:glycosyltransferase involved in cell wall biosynthesis
MKISIIHPSRNRPKMAFDTIKEWIGRAKNPENIQYVLSLDDTESMQDQYRSYLSGIEKEIHTCYNNNRSAIDAINNAVQHCTGDLFIVVSDDFECPQHWDEQLVQLLDDKEDYVVKTQDGTQPWIITLPIMDRTYYNRFGYIYYPEYRHMFCDTEMSHVGALLGRTITSNIVFPHRHYTTGAMKRDAVNVRNDSTWVQGEELYLERLKTNFGIENPLPIQLPEHHKNWLKAKNIAI